MRVAALLVLALVALCGASQEQSVEVNSLDEFDEFEDVQAVVEPEQTVVETPEEQQTEESISVNGAESVKKPVVKRVSGFQRFGTAEWIGVAWVALCAVIYIIGRPLNYAIAKKFSSRFSDLFHTHFSHITRARPLSPLSSEGPKFSDDEPVESGDMMFARDSSSVFQAWVSGRSTVFGGLVTLETSGRHDLYSMIRDMVMPSTRSRGMDVITLEFALRSMDPFLFCLVPKSEVSDINESNGEFAKLAELRSNNELTQLAGSGRAKKMRQFAVLADSGEIANQLLRDSFLKMFKAEPEIMNYVYTVIISDLNTIPISGFDTIPAQVARFTYRLPPSTKWEIVEKLLELTIAFVDHINTYKAPRLAKQKCVDARAKLQDEAKKLKKESQEEAFQKKQQEKKRQEKLAYESMSPESREKHDRKEQKRKMKKAAKSRTRVKMA